MPFSSVLVDSHVKPGEASDAPVLTLNTQPMPDLVAEKSLKCIRCGFCLDACPTFRLTGNEADSPRGRVYLMRSVTEGAIPLDAGVRDHLDACLGCRACETACPSGVEYAQILEHFRARMETAGVRPSQQSFARHQL